MTTRPLLILFDCDGTLTDSQHHIVAAMSTAMRANGLPEPAPATIRATIGLSLVAAVAALLPAEDATRHRQVADAYVAAARAAGQGGEPLFPGIAAMLAQLHGHGHVLGVATGKGRRGLDMTLHSHGLRDLFTTLQTADRCAGKPDPEMVFKAMTEAGIDPEDTVVVGDTSFDMLMAGNAGVAAIGVAWGYHTPQALRQAGARAVIDEIGDLPETLIRTMGVAG